MKMSSLVLYCVLSVLALSNVAVADDNQLWKVKLITGSKFFNGYRCNTSTGQCWHLQGTQWQHFDESATITAGAAGTYDIAPIEIPESDNWAIIRWNVATGQSWIVQNNKWTEIAAD
jgi:hypothetical protein